MAIQLVNPARCRLWEMHSRLGEQVDIHTCSTLLNSMKLHGQKQPVLARRITSVDGCEFELIYGARRLFVAQQLGVDLLVECKELDDRTALIEMDIENRVREDISAYERGISYRRWLNAGHFANQTMLAKSLGVSAAQICRLLKYAELPTVVVAAFASPHEIREEWAGTLAKHCQDAAKRTEILARARAARFLTSPRSAQATFESLLSGARRSVKGVSDKVIRSSNGVPLFRVAFKSKTVHLVISREKLDTELLDVITKRIAGVFEDVTGKPPEPGFSPIVRRDRAKYRTDTATSPQSANS
jgi:ParB/RepB/Spo0J family partition protein